jgi:hypothetical protein
MNGDELQNRLDAAKTGLRIIGGLADPIGFVGKTAEVSGKLERFRMGLEGDVWYFLIGGPSQYFTVIEESKDVNVIIDSICSFYTKSSNSNASFDSLIEQTIAFGLAYKLNSNGLAIMLDALQIEGHIFVFKNVGNWVATHLHQRRSQLIGYSTELLEVEQKVIAYIISLRQH